MNTQRPYVLVPMGMHMLELVRHNPINVVAVLDYRDNGSLQRAGVSELCGQVIPLGVEKQAPFFSYLSNRSYYKWLGSIIDKLSETYPDCHFVISSNYTPVNRFLIDRVGAERVELWEDGMNHYLRMESLLPSYKLKAFAKLLAGYYPRGIFDIDYRGNQLLVRDRFESQNLNYPIKQLSSGEAFYIGQPLVEDNLISESLYRSKLNDYFADKKVIYLPHPREQYRAWVTELFEVRQLDSSAEDYLGKVGANEIYSAFSTVNVNLQCDTNRYLAKHLGLHKIAARLADLETGVELV